MKVVRCSDANYDRITEYAEKSGLRISQCVDLAIAGLAGDEKSPSESLMDELLLLREEICQIRWGMTIEERLDEMRKEDENDDGGPFYWRSRRDSPSLADIGSTVYRMMRIVEPPGGAV